MVSYGLGDDSHLDGGVLRHITKLFATGGLLRSAGQGGVGYCVAEGVGGVLNRRDHGGEKLAVEFPGVEGSFSGLGSAARW